MATKTKNNAGFEQLALIVVFAVALGAIGGYFIYHQVKVSNERQLYAEADKEAKAYINSIAAKYPGKLAADNGCSRTSAKYTEGFLGCNVETTLEIVLTPNIASKDIIEFADEQKKNISWEQTYQSEGPGLTSPNDIKAYIFRLKDKTCGVHYRLKDDGSSATSPVLILDDGRKVLVISAGCSGPAMAEYYN